MKNMIYKYRCILVVLKIDQFVVMILFLNKKKANQLLRQEQRFANRIDNERLNKSLPVLINDTVNPVEYFYLRSSCRQVVKRTTDGALAVNIDQENGLKKNDDGEIIDGQFIDRSQLTPCREGVLLGIEDGQPSREQLRMRRKAEVLQYKNNNTNQKTRSQRYTDAVRNRTKGTGSAGQQSEDTGTNQNPNNYTRIGNTLILGCPFNSTKYVSNSRSGVPGRKTLLFLDRNIKYRDYL